MHSRLILALFVLASFVYSQDEKWDVTAPPLPTRDLSFEVTEGTWLDLDVHPTTSEVVFSMLGDIYVLPISGGEARCIRSGLQWDMHPRWSPDGESIAFTSDESGGDNLWVMEADGSNAYAVTKETFRLVCSPCWTPDGRYLIGRKHFTATRSLGSGEMWMYPLSGGPGLQLTKRKNDQQDVNEPFVSPDGKTLYWSEDVSGGSTFEYNKDPNGQIYVVFAKDLDSGEVRREITGNGGAIRPIPSPDGKSLAFIRRIRARSVLHVKDLESGSIRALWDGLSRDMQETWAIHGVYPAYAWVPDGSALVIWAKGGLWRVDATSGAAQRIPFRAKVRTKLVETLRRKTEFGGDTVRTKVCRWPAIAPAGDVVAYQALGRIWRRALEGGEPTVVSPDGRWAHMPSWSPNGSDLVYATWHDVEGGRIRISAARDFRTVGDRERDVVSDPGHYAWPSFSPDGQWIVYQRMGGDGLRGRAFTTKPGIYRVRVAGGRPILVTTTGSRPRFDGTGDRILLHENAGPDLVLASVDLDGGDRRELARSKYATEFAVSPDGRWLAFTELWNAYVCPLPSTGGTLAVSTAMKQVPLVRITRDAGQDLSFSADSKRIHVGLGPRVSVRDVASMFEAPFGTRASDAGKVDPETDVTHHDLSVEAPADRPETTLFVENARIVTMEGDQVIDGGAILVRGNRIEGVYDRTAAGGLTLPEGTRRLDVRGRTVLPGYVDVHAHIRHGGDMMPQRNWQHLANLSFGVTTTHDPSNDTRATFAASELQRTGAILAPRIFSTGTILYGADGDFKAVVDDLDDALSHIRRTAVFGAQSVKSYNQPRRDQRQQILKAARKVGVNVVPEGGSTLAHNLTHIIDGHTTLEHALPIGVVYDDVLTLFSKSGTAYTPTLIVGYGGIWGEDWWYHKDEVWRHERLLRWMPRHLLDSRARRRTAAPDEEYHHRDLARMAAELARRGTIVEVGAHGQVQGLGVHWEMRMFAQGGMSPHDALKTGTIRAARGLGLDHEVGSITAGKLADLVVVEGDPLERLEDAEKVTWLIFNGRLYDAKTLEQVHPKKQALPPGPWLGDTTETHSDLPVGCPCGRTHR